MPVTTETAKNFWDSLRRAGDCNVAIVTATGTFTHHDLQRQVDTFAAALSVAGIGAGDRIAVAGASAVDSVVHLLACVSTAACVPINPDSSASEFERVLRDTRSTSLLADHDCPSTVLDAARAVGIRILEFRSLSRPESAPEPTVRPNPDDIALILTSSGSTASRRIIPITQSMLRGRAYNVRNFLALTASDRCMALMPVFHGGGLLIPVLGSLFAGGSVAFPGSFPFHKFERMVEELQPTWVAVPPPFVERLLSDECEWSGNYTCLRAFFTGGAPMPPRSVEAIERKFGVILQNGYGSTECGGIAANPMPPARRKAASVGISIGPEIAILDPEGHPVAPGSTGEVAVCGPGVFRGYETPGGLDISTLTESWHRTGDAGYQDPDGFLFLTGRLNEVINRGGEKFSPGEVEAVLRAHPAVADAVVFPVPHAVLGQEAAALVVMRGSGVTVDDVRGSVSAELSRVKMPRAILRVTEIPTNPAGKVMRSRLAELYADQLKAALAVRPAYKPPRTPLENRIAALWSDILKTDRIGLHDRFADLGGDSVQAVSMLVRLSAVQGCEIDVRELWRSPTVASLAELVSAHSKGNVSLLFPVETAGSLPPLFCILPGWFPEVEHLGRYLGPDQPLYALIPDPRPGGPQHGMDANQIVEACERAIRAVRGSGPYLLVGRSIGGAVAVHLANRLQQAGESVPFVGLIDTNYPGVPGHRTLPAPLRLLEQFMGELILQPRGQWRQWIMSLPARAFRRHARLRRGRTEAERAAHAMNTRLELLFTDTPERRFEGRLTMFAAEQSPLRGFIDRRIYWSRAATDGLELHHLPGTHNLMTQEPLLAGFAEVLCACLTRATHG